MGLAGFFALCIGSGLIVQRDYEISWDYQQAFWKDVVRLCPDITDGTVILVDEKVLNNPDQIQAFSWSLPGVLFQLYHFPNEWKFTPRVYRLKEFWQNEIASAGSTSQLSRIIWGWVEPSDRERTLDLSNIILLEVNNGQLTRRTEPLTIDRQILPLKKMPASGPLPFEKGILYEYLIRMSNEERINYLK